MLTTIFIVGVIVLVIAFFLTIHSYFCRDSLLDWKFLATLLVVGSVLVLSHKYKKIDINLGSSGFGISMEEKAEDYNNLNNNIIEVAKGLPPEKNDTILQGTTRNKFLYEQFKKSKDEQKRVEMFYKLQSGVTGSSTATLQAIK